MNILAETDSFRLVKSTTKDGVNYYDIYTVPHSEMEQNGIELVLSTPYINSITEPGDYKPTELYFRVGDSLNRPNLARYIELLKEAGEFAELVSKALNVPFANK